MADLFFFLQWSQLITIINWDFLKYSKLSSYTQENAKLNELKTKIVKLINDIF
jgi:hypothetical protein